MISATQALPDLTTINKINKSKDSKEKSSQLNLYSRSSPVSNTEEGTGIITMYDAHEASD